MHIEPVFGFVRGTPVKFDVCAESMSCFTMFLLLRWNHAPTSVGSSLISKSFGKMNFFPKQFVPFQGFQKVVV